ncbi:MAG: hypothetical protein V1870_02965, partial [Candidatus Aenigmatarchaeota archaeon]
MVRLLKVSDPRKRIKSFYASPNIYPTRTRFYYLMRDNSNATFLEDIASISCVGDSRKFIVHEIMGENYDLDTAHSTGILYGERGTVLIDKPVFNPKTGTVDGMVYINGRHIPDPEIFNRDSSESGLYAGDGRKIRVYGSREGFRFMSYDDNGKFAVPVANRADSLLDVFPPENFGYPLRFVDDLDDAVRIYEKTGLADA